MCLAKVGAIHVLEQHPIHEKLDKPEVVSPDGWIAKEIGLFRFLTEHEPPRPYRLWDQIKQDLIASEMRSVCLSIILPISVIWGLLGGLVHGALDQFIIFYVLLFMLIPIPFFLVLYLFLLCVTVVGIRRSNLVVARLKKIEQHPLRDMKELEHPIGGVAEYENGKSGNVVFAGMPEICEIFEQGIEVEFLVMRVRLTQYCQVIAYREKL